MMLIPAKEGSKIGVGMRTSSGDNEFSFGIETNLAGTPAMDRVWEYISKSKEDDKIHENLAGNISRSLMLDDTDNWFFDNVVEPLGIQYSKSFNNMGEKIPINDIVPYHLYTWWVNYQKQNEFNPVHDHTGVYSFVIWMKIPTSYEEQNLNKINNTKRISAFDFQYTDTLGRISNFTYQLSPELEGTMVFFPSKLKHQVYPFFNCDETRISVSGNVGLDITKRL